MLAMKNIFILFLSLISFNSFAGIVIVSDLDDTIKITNSGEEVDGAINAVFSNDVFSGISDFFTASRFYADEVHVLSASPLILRPKIISTLRKHRIQIESLTLKNALMGESKLAYKMKELQRLLEKGSDDFILMGDDVGQDPEVYDEIKKLYPNRILAIYIHEIKGRKLPSSAFKYWTSFDLFLKEYVAGRMSTAWVDQAAEKMLTEKEMELVFPDFARCPLTPEIWLWQLRSLFARESFALAKKFNLYCLSRSSGI
jgi:phosphatidate phosphatase APP1